MNWGGKIFNQAQGFTIIAYKNKNKTNIKLTNKELDPGKTDSYTWIMI